MSIFKFCMFFFQKIQFFCSISQFRAINGTISIVSFKIVTESISKIVESKVKMFGRVKPKSIKNVFNAINFRGFPPIK